MPPAFTPLPAVPDHPSLERDVLEAWRRELTFEELREANAAGPRWSFIDGPITANKKMGVHHMWGRTLKDVFQRYKALNGYHQRYQNGYDCQGLWVEVGVERELGLNSKQEIEEYGLAEFARKCRDKVAWSAGEITKQSQRLGMWMDWGNDYFTFSDTNIEYIWRFLKVVDDKGLLAKGHRGTEWCPRCGTSISQHELHGSFHDKTDPSLFVRFPLTGRDGEALVVWTTTPWTLPANVAAAVNPDAEYGRRANGDWVAVARYPDDEFVARVKGAELVGLAYTGPFDHLPSAEGLQHRVVAWDEVSMEDGTGIVHIAPGCGGEDFELGKAEGLAILAPIDEAGRFLPQYGWLQGISTVEAKDRIIDDLRERGLLVKAGEIVHRYPFCWRCETPLVFRLTDDWFIQADPVRQQLLDANATVEWIPDYFGKRMDDWLRNLADWNISRKRYFGLPLPFYPCACGHLNVIGSRAELVERATAGIEGLEELHRPWIDAVTIRCASCGAEDVTRVPEVGDVWLDAGIVPFATLGWLNEQTVPGGYANGASKGLSGADLPDQAYWQDWFPADWVSEMREQIRLWFYSLLFMSVILDGRAPYKKVLSYEKLLDADGREMHGSLGNAIDADDAFESMGADVMRWMYCAQPPSQNIRFGYAPAGDVKRKLLTLWNSVSFLVTYANIEEWKPRWSDLENGPQGDLTPLDRWLVARTQKLLAEAGEGYESFLTVGVVKSFESFVDDLSNWYIRRSRRRFYGNDEAAFSTLWYALAQSLRVVGPIMPFLSDHLWRNLVAGPCPEAPRSVFLAGWATPDPRLADDRLVDEIFEVRRIVELGRQARATGGVKNRQPLAHAVVFGGGLAAAHIEEIADELRVKSVRFEEGAVARVRFKPNLPVLGPRFGKRLPAIKAALESGAYELDGADVIVDGERLSGDDLLRERLPVREGWFVAADGDLSVEIDTELDDALLLEGRVYDVIHHVNSLRKDTGLELTDRITLRLPEEDVDLLPHAARIADETLALDVLFEGDTVTIEKSTSGAR
jgi:isoleucyl-tRNA synthetase